MDDCHRHEKDWTRWHRFKKAKVTRDYAGDYRTLVPFVFIGLLDL